ncbi:coiled-coil domain-containing protein [Cysteiniphilum halobium]|uniref:coiled-coil domain-containing protein n=1 Tax=Cysteiniphilum halobium TaxID=2219059 RepID=UPI003F875EA7
MDDNSLRFTPDGILNAMTHLATKDEMNNLRQEVRRLEDKMETSFKDVRSEIKDVRSEIKDVRSEIKDVRSEVKDTNKRIDKVMNMLYTMSFGIIAGILMPVILKFF